VGCGTINRDCAGAAGPDFDAARRRFIAQQGAARLITYATVLRDTGCGESSNGWRRPPC
jgi:hypothetical protein